jgi:Domain of unknown function (DUF4920)
MLRMRVLTALIVIALTAPPLSADQTLGAGVKLTEPTSIAALYAAPEKFVGKPVRLDGVVTAVCEEMGCWMALADSADSRQTVRFKVDHDGAITFPIAARGKRASAEGVFQRIDAGDKEGNEAAREQLAAQPTASDFGKKYQVKVTGAVVR